MGLIIDGVQNWYKGKGWTFLQNSKMGGGGAGIKMRKFGKAKN